MERNPSGGYVQRSSNISVLDKKNPELAFHFFHFCIYFKF